MTSGLTRGCGEFAGVELAIAVAVLAAEAGGEAFAMRLARQRLAAAAG